MNATRLNYCSKNEKVKIFEVDGGKGAIENVKSLGLEIGDEIEIVSRKSGRGQISVSHGGEKIPIGYELASKILVECESDPETTLDNIKIGDKVKVTKMKATGDIRFRLLDMGLVKGVSLKIVRLAPLGDPIEVMLNGFNLSLRLEEAKNINVKILEVSRNGRGGGNRWRLKW